ncbi:MAG: 4Fe-4S binding protein [Armatimonadetes bacterium]|nr:4Fe-4S binding protein [Armatimonadota bacterium]
MIKLVIDRDRCKSCGLCVAVCPRRNLRLSESINEAGYHPTEQCEEGKCSGCGLCALMCPDIVFSIYRVRGRGESNE